MRQKIMTFHINDVEWFAKEFNLTNEEASDKFGGRTPFKCTYIIKGKDGKRREEYLLYDINGTEIDINTLNGYQRGLLWRCDALFFKDVSDIEGVVDYNCKYEENS